MKFLDTEGLKYFRQKLDERYISAGERGVASGVATLDANGKLNSSQIPTGLDDYIPVDTLPKSGMQENVFYYVITGGDSDTAQISLGTEGHTYRYVGGEGAHWVDISSLDTATKALQDADGNVISTTYVKVQAGKQLSTEDYTTAEKEKLEGLHNYTLPEATADTLGGVKVGAGLTVASGVLSAEVKAADIADFITAGKPMRRMCRRPAMWHTARRKKKSSPDLRIIPCRSREMRSAASKTAGMSSSEPTVRRTWNCRTSQP